MTTLLWLTLPYVAFTSFVVGHIWRYRNDQFGWTTRSSQSHEGRLLRLGSPLFHFGLLAVLGGHALGIGIPASWTAAVGVSEHAYHLMSVSFGTLSGLATVTGLAILLYRRFSVSAVRAATTTIDKVMYLMLGTAILSGMLNTIGSNLIGGGYDYRATVSPWFRSLFTLSPQPELMVGIPLSF
ncbi:MAG TPA: respiratory nitrate reductase subunit gamma, partial [Pseudonocardiaceae bacterium]|nr:respiratory nitrate reductase subunit gamma [Pseudonocardiaceae bacterium]